MKHAYALLAALPSIVGQAQVIHEIEVEDNEFDPPFLTINAGDIVSIIWDEDVVFDHSFVQVDAATWMSNGTTPLPGGYQLGDGTPMPGHAHTIAPTADVWYVCGFHADMGMKGTITVIGGTNGIDDPVTQDQFRFAPNPAVESTHLFAPDGGTFTVQLTDAAGRTCQHTMLSPGQTLKLDALAPGAYTALVHDADGSLLSRQRLIIAR